MRMIFVIFVTGILLVPATHGASSPNVIAATATSESSHSATVNCLLKPACKGSWSPGSADSGADEGVYVQFEDMVDADAVDIVSSDDDLEGDFTVSMNGALVGRSPLKPSGTGDKHIVRYAVPGGRIKSLFFRLGVREGGWVNFSLYAIRFYQKGKPLELTLPALVPGSVTATSVLEPKVAYQPANLFDSRYDFAWSTNGQVTTGKGESIEVKFDQPQNLSGLIVWNGYQRSEEHFEANGRVAAMSANDGQVTNRFSLSDKMGSQRIVFAQPMKNVSSLKLTIDAITAGAKYRDVLLSELRFLDDHGQILVPEVKGIVPESSSLTEPLVDKSLTTVVCGSSPTDGVFQRSLRLRRDGSFVIYTDDEIFASGKGGRKMNQVLEGSWELRGSEVRIFGKRYADAIVGQKYSPSVARVPASIFQSDLKISRFHDLAPAEKQQLVSLILTRIGVVSGSTKAVQVWKVGGGPLASGEDEKTLLANLVKSLDTMNPWTFRSPILADAMLPSDQTGPCREIY
jgi:hypothetical protein